MRKHDVRKGAPLRRCDGNTIDEKIGNDAAFVGRDFEFLEGAFVQARFLRRAMSRPCPAGRSGDSNPQFLEHTANRVVF